MGSVDILIVNALKAEQDAVEEVAKSKYGTAGHEIVWRRRGGAGGIPQYFLTSIQHDTGATLSIALARAPGMGTELVSPVASSLVTYLRPHCLAMTGVCAGNPEDVALGDVIVAAFAYNYELGKRTEHAYETDYRQREMSREWEELAEDLSPINLPSYGVAAESESRLWLLFCLYADQQPLGLPARRQYFRGDAWKAAVISMQADGLITKDGVNLRLTEEGRSAVEDSMLLDVEGPATLPFKIVTGPMATGNVVVKDGITWDSLRLGGVRSVLGLEMEASAVATAARTLAVPEWIVVKGVMDYANPRKDDRYKPFAARASAEVFFEFISKAMPRRHVDATKMSRSRIRSVFVIGGATGEVTDQSKEWDDLARACVVLGETIARAGCELVVCSPFSNSADFHSIRGFVTAGGTILQLHSPRHPEVEERKTEIRPLLDGAVKVVEFKYPAPESESSEGWSQAWLLCQLEALRHADVVIAIGGKPAATASTLLHFAEARRKPIVPFSFLGGASARAFARKDWPILDPPLDLVTLQEKSRISEAMLFADRLVTSYITTRRMKTVASDTVFISRARRDLEFSDVLARSLRAEGRTVILGDDQVRTDRMVEPAIEEGILRCGVFVVLWSSSYALSVYCNDELHLGLVRQEVGEAQVVIFNLDGSDVVPAGARNVVQVVAASPDGLIDAARAIGI